MILLSSPERGTEYYRGPRPSTPVDQAVPRWEARSLTEVKVSLPVFRAVGEPLTLEGIYQFYGRLEIFQPLKACGVTLLILLVLTTVVVFLSSRTKALPEADEFSAPPESEEEVLVPEPPTETGGSLPVERDEYWFDDTLTMEDLPPLEEPTQAAAEVAETMAPPEPSLFAPVSGLGWEAFLGTRLDFELNRASAQNQDLALVLLTVKEGSVAPAAWGRAVREAFPSIDLDFEHEGGAAVVLPGRTLEQALQSARAFVETADQTLGGAVVHAGVASRAGRLLSSATLLGEAASAKRRSLAGTVRVLGLKADPDRYREHLASASA